MYLRAQRMSNVRVLSWSSFYWYILLHFSTFSTIDLNTEEQKSKNVTLLESIIELLFSESGGQGGQPGMYIKGWQTSRWGHNKMETVTADDEDNDEAHCK